MPQQPQRSDSQGVLAGQHNKLEYGVTPETLQQLFLSHRHTGTVLDAQPVRAVILADTVTGHLYNITMKNGVLTPVRIS